MSKISSIKQALTISGTKRKASISKSDYLKTGSTLLDLAISGKRAGGFAKGRYFWIVGDSSSGKTFLTLTCLAEASINTAFDGYRFIYDNIEDGALMDFERYFGKRMAERVEPPAGSVDEPEYSQTIEDFYYNLDDAHAKGTPFIYVLDSMDALGSSYGDRKFQEAKQAARKGTAAKGDYGDGKAKINSTSIRRAVSRLSKTGSILIILSQTRDDIGAGLFDEQKTHAGGHALKFYSTVQLWSSVGKRIKKADGARKEVIGVISRIKTKKNRLTGKERTVEVPIYYSVGIDDIGSMVDFIAEYGRWNKAGAYIDASDDFADVKLQRSTLISYIEENDLREEVEAIAEEVWLEKETRLDTHRRSKYE